MAICNKLLTYSYYIQGGISLQGELKLINKKVIVMVYYILYKLSNFNPFFCKYLLINYKLLHNLGSKSN